jgi:hypothetical protein
VLSSGESIFILFETQQQRRIRKEGEKNGLMIDHELHVKCERLCMSSHLSRGDLMGLYMVVLPANYDNVVKHMISIINAYNLKRPL